MQAFAILHGAPRLLATDLDGTLLRPNESVSPRGRRGSR